MHTTALLSLMIGLATTAHGQSGRPPCNAPGVLQDREDCVRARVDTADARLWRLTGRAIELLPERARRPFLDSSQQRLDSAYARCRRITRDPVTINLPSPAHAACLVEADSLLSARMGRQFRFDQSDPANHGGCLAYEPDTVTLTGTLQRRTYPGLPNFESVKKGDDAETSLYLVVRVPLCVSRNVNDVYVPTAGVRVIQLVLDSVGYDDLRPHLDKIVTVRGTLFHLHTAHHHAELLLSVEK